MAADEAALDRVRESFALQGAMGTLGAQLTHLAPGEVDISFDWAPGLTQQHGFIHAGMLAAALDSACGYAAFSLMPLDAAVLTIEFKINLLAPAQGDYLEAVGTVVRSGRTLTICQLEVFGVTEQGRAQVALGQQTLICLQGKQDR